MYVVFMLDNNNFFWKSQYILYLYTLAPYYVSDQLCLLQMKASVNLL